jgi:hypothetical protein
VPSAASVVDIAGMVLVGFALVVVFGIAFLALRQHDRMFPRGWDRTGWKPDSSNGWFATKFTWLSGGRGQ